MGSGEPALVPEWYRAGKGGKTTDPNSDGNAVGIFSRNRLPLISCDRDSRRSSDSSGSVRSDKNSSPGTRAYSNFGRKDRKKNPDPRDIERDRPLSAGTGSRYYRDSVVESRTDRDRSWRNSHSGVLGRHGELWPKSLESDSKTVVLCRENASSGGIRRALSFKRDFPTLASVEKKGVLDTGRVFTAVQSLPLPALATVGGDRWTSALAEVPGVVGDNASTLSAAVKTAPVSPVSLAMTNSTGMNMAEALIQASSQVRNAPQLSGDSSRADELTLRQCKQLIPMRPSMPKTAGLNSLEKSKFRGATKGGDFGGPPKNGQQLSSLLLLANDALRSPAARSDVSKASQIGNFQVLCRQGTGVISPTAVKDAGSQDVYLKSSINPNLKAESKSTNMSLLSSSKPSLGSFREKRPLSLPQNRNEFFNSLRKKTSVNHSIAAAVPEPSCCGTMEKSLSLEQHAWTCADFSIADSYVINQEGDFPDEISTDAYVINQEENTGDSGASCGEDTDTAFVEKQLDRRFLSQSPEDDGENKQSSCCTDCNCHPVVDLDEQEKAFLLSLGWKEDAMEEALTDEEITAFIKQYEELRPYSKLSERFEAASLSFGANLLKL